MRERYWCAELRRSERLEAERIAFLERTRSREAARAFAEQTLRNYRRAVVHRAPPAGSATFRLRLIGSCCYFKRYLRH
jgi:hypothetical protein